MTGLQKGKVKGLRPFLPAILQFCNPAIFLLVPALLIAQPGPSLSSHDRDLVLVMLRRAGADVEKHYYDPTFHGVNLKAQLAAAERRLETAATLADAFSTVADFLQQFDDSHTAFIPPSLGTRVDYGWQMAMVGDHALIIHVDPDSDAAARGLTPGDRVLLLNAFTPSRANVSRLSYYYRFIRPQARQRIAVLKPDGSAQTVDVTSRRSSGPIVNDGDLANELDQLIERGRDRTATVGDRVLVWRMAVFARPESVDEVIGKARRYDTLVLDLRGNGGGAVTALQELVSRCFDREVVVAVETRRGGRPTREVARPGKSPFTGRLIVLVDSRSASAAEMFARIVQIEARGTVVGDRTAGAVMRSHLFPHQGDVLSAVYATSVTVADVRMSDGGSLEKVGVEPDEIVLPRPSDLAAGRDPVLAHAIALAGESLTPEEAGRLFK
jgi:C-terminal processing protease CtpA/Prc